MLGGVITNFNVLADSDSAPRSLNRSHYKLLSCDRKMMVYEEKTYTTQNLHSIKQACKKKIANYSF